MCFLIYQKREIKIINIHFFRYKHYSFKRQVYFSGLSFINNHNLTSLSLNPKILKVIY
jgi:hypothetical protein